jgi:Lon protease-like protein
MSSFQLPIFPLPLVLFPGASQPLHIFEPRYRRMLADCLAGSRQFGISMVDPGTEPDPSPRPGEAGCVAVLQQCQALPDGRSNILTLGGTRYLLREYVTSDLPYRIARVEPFDDEPDAAADQDGLTARVRTTFGRLQAAIQAMGDAPAGADDIPTEPKALSFHVASAIPVEPRIKLTLLTLRSTRARLEVLDRLLETLAPEAASRASLHERARLNGHGGRYRAGLAGG